MTPEELLLQQAEHHSAQLDILNHSLYVMNNYLMFMAATVALIGALMMFLVGHAITKGR